MFLPEKWISLAALRQLPKGPMCRTFSAHARSCNGFLASEPASSLEREGPSIGLEGATFFVVMSNVNVARIP